MGKNKTYFSQKIAMSGKNIEEIKEEKLNRLRRKNVKETLTTSECEEGQETVELSLEIPVFESVSEVPELEPGEIVYVKNEGVFVEDGS